MIEQQKPSRLHPMKGVEIWRNPRNNFVVFQLHYSADPAKNSAEFKTAIKSGMTRRAYMMEYELAWESFAGLPVYPDFDPRLHKVNDIIHPHRGLPLLRGWDWGLTPACVVAQLQGEQLCILKEVRAFNMGASRFVPKAMDEIRLAFPEWSRAEDWLDFVDPAGFAKAQSDEKSCVDVLFEWDSRLNVHGGAIDWEKRRSSVENRLTKITREGPGFKISGTECPVLVTGFTGGYRYREEEVEIESAKLRPIKNEYSHPHDALQMITTGIDTHMARHYANRKPIPRPGYYRSRVA